MTIFVWIENNIMEQFDCKSVGGREIYDTLPDKLKEEMKLFWRTNTKINQLKKKKNKLNDQIKDINEELKQLKKQQTKSLPNIRYTKRNFIPTISFSIDKRSNTYLCVIKLKHSSKSFYLGKFDEVKTKLSNELNEDWSNYSLNKFKICLREIVENVIMDFIDITDVNSIWEESNYKLNFKNVIEKYKTKKSL